MQQFDVLVVGAGLSGCVMAERLASQKNKKILVIDKKEFVAGHCHDYVNKRGILVHKYGPHYFRTNDDEVLTYLSGFTDWHPFTPRIVSEVDGAQYPFPINRATLNAFFKIDLKTEAEAEAFLASKRIPIAEPKNAEEAVLARAGKELYEKFFKQYTIKQWGIDPLKLSPKVTMRIPIRTNDDDRYLTEKFQAIPKDGYTKMCERILDHPNITVELGVDFSEMQDRITYTTLVYTGCIDEYYNYQFGRLSYRSLRFKEEHYQQEFYQNYPQINYPNEHDYTRIVEYKHVTGQQSDWTTIIKEYPQAEGEPFYPVSTDEDKEMYKKYEAAAKKLTNTFFVGRLAQYKYINMDQAVRNALDTFAEIQQTIA